MPPSGVCINRRPIPPFFIHQSKDSPKSARLQHLRREVKTWKLFGEGFVVEEKLRPKLHNGQTPNTTRQPKNRLSQDTGHFNRIRREVFLVWHVDVQIGKTNSRDQGNEWKWCIYAAGFSKASATGPKNGEFTMQLGLRRTLDAEAVGPAKLGRRSKRSRPAQSDSLGKGQEAAEDEREDLEAGHWSWVDLSSFCSQVKWFFGTKMPMHPNPEMENLLDNTLEFAAECKNQFLINIKYTRERALKKKTKVTHLAKM